jgi:hypothetical protein
MGDLQIIKKRELEEKLHQWREETGAQMMQPNPDYDSSIKVDEYYNEY